MQVTELRFWTRGMGCAVHFVLQAIAVGCLYCLIRLLLLNDPIFVSGQIERHSQGRYPSQRNDNLYDSSVTRPGEQDVFRSRVLQWHILYCSKSRICNDYTDSICFLCSPCHCDLNCTHFGDCCPDIAIETGGNFQRPFTGSDTNVLSCEAVSLQRFISDGTGITKENTDLMPVFTHPGYQKRKYFLISHCPHAFTEDASECENSGTAPVASVANDSSLMFKNKYCARCNDVHDIIFWDIQVSCEKALNLSLFLTPREIITRRLSPSNCFIEYVPPQSKAPRSCYSEPTMITKCNVTGRWTKRDAFLEKACHSYLTPKRMDNILYKNIFCFMCNIDDNPSHQMKLKECQDNSAFWNPAMEVTVHHSDVVRPEAREYVFGDVPFKLCDQRGIYDYDEEECREIRCEVGQHLVSGSCQPMFLSARGLEFELYFGLRPSESIDLSGDADLLYNLPAEMEIYLSQKILEAKFILEDFAMAFNTTEPDGRCSQSSSDLSVYARLVSHIAADQGTLQNDLLQARHSRFSIDTRSWNISFQGFPSESAWHLMHPSRRPSLQSLTTCVVIVSNSQLKQRKDGTRKVGTTTPDPTAVPDNPSPPSIRVTSLLDCPRVRLLSHEYTVDGYHSSLTLTWGDVVLTNNQYTMDLNGNVSICLSDFAKKFQNFNVSTEEKTLATVLLTISILCLSICFIVFLVYSVLRSLSGKNNMILVVCLFCSQISLLIGYLVDDTGRMCVVAGVATHYFTLTVYCSLLVCSYHVYAMFTTMHLSTKVTKDSRWLVYYCCFTVTIPLVIVAAVIAVYGSRKLTWRTLGYGGGPICLLSSTTALWLSLFLPLIVAMVPVTVLYCLTTKSLRHNKDIETNATDEKHVNFYFRAAILTTLIWTMGIAGIVTSLPPLRIVALIFQCILGLYVFISLVLTPRVTRLLSGSCCQSRHPPRGRTSLNMKMASSKDCPVTPPCIVATGYRKREPVELRSSKGRHPTERYTKRGDSLEYAA